MKSIIAALISVLVVLGGLISAHANEQAVQPQQNFTVNFQWDSKFIPWKPTGDAVVIDQITNIVDEAIDSRLTYRMVGYAKVKETTYVTTGSLSYKNVRSITSKDVQELASVVGASLFVVSLDKGGKIVLSRKLKAEGLGLGRYGSDYGCMQQRIPIFRADLNHDGHPEVFYYTGRPNELNYAAKDSLNLNILRGTDFERVFGTEILRDAVSGEEPSPDQASKHYTEYGLNGMDTDFSIPGERSLTKLFFGDLQRTKQMELLVWRRDYQDRTGWQFSKEKFELYTMSPDVTFTKTTLTSEQGHALLEKNNLTWKQGFPNQNFCNAEGKPTDKPLITNIDDPILKQ